MRNRSLSRVYLFYSFIATRLVASSANCSGTDAVKITFYGYPDNSPPGSGIRCRLDSRSDCSSCAANSSRVYTSDDCGPRGETAGGTGTYEDPVTMASAGIWFCHQEIVYLPFLKKYFRYEDYCADCTTDVASGILHIDLWTGSTTVDGGALQDKCEKLLTPAENQTMIRNPSSELPVDLTTLFVAESKDRGLCNGTEIKAGATRISTEWRRVWLVGVFLLQLAVISLQ